MEPVGDFYELAGTSEVISKRFSTLASAQAVYIFGDEERGVPLASRNPH